MERYLKLRGIILYIFFQTAFQSCILADAKRDIEPNCYSRFDYEYKVVQKIVALENECSELHETNDELRTEIGDLSNKVEGNNSTSFKFLPNIHVFLVLPLGCLWCDDAVLVSHLCLYSYQLVSYGGPKK